ncbi:thioredoxin family protein [Dinghuibacter silviterrae]|uniref:Thioredoxin-like protein n=1 Tax=Dinghuibacter silviterrae TaxID=1539049 RepID=A0A4R8DWD4_9BACT|nr:thioredoxin family protein [Dinghuibacter silviterrae]TDX01727.1 thioredoxin-like protein [Dinghuibacter silviterrae]
MMNIFYALILLATWHYDLDEAKQLAQKEHKHILLNFSGSDWCGPCIVLRQEVLDNPAFQQMADTTLVLVNADFPRKKKDQLPARQQAINSALADKYNPDGHFPLTLLLDADGKVVYTWDGNPGLSAAAFATEVKKRADADHL